MNSIYGNNNTNPIMFPIAVFLAYPCQRTLALFPNKIVMSCPFSQQNCYIYKGIELRELEEEVKAYILVYQYHTFHLTPHI